jgi:toxin-antitoxin system PIN domain toxin
MAVRHWLAGAHELPEPIGVLPDAAAAFIRIVTNRRIWARPSSLDDAIGVLTEFLAAPRVTLVSPPSRRWSLFLDLCRSGGIRGDDITDAYLAAGAMSVNATFVTSDRGFHRFRALKLQVLKT